MSVTRHLICVLLVCLGLPSAAAAERPATHEEATAVAAVYGMPVECSKVVVSEQDSRYARWDFLYSGDCEPVGNGFGIALRDQAGTWTDVHQASDNSDACPTTPVPTAVGVELRACARPSRGVFLTDFLKERGVIKPRRLPHGAHSLLGPLRWFGWGRPAAKAWGVLDYSDASASFKAPIKLRASRVRYCGAKRFYTQLTLTFRRRSDRRAYPHFEGKLPSGCP